eukprot:scaffold652342_cov42-Prasinocladus_malaysianus.AAC.1
MFAALGGPCLCRCVRFFRDCPPTSRSGQSNRLKAAATGTSRRGSSQRRPDFRPDPDLASSMFPDEAFGPAPPLPTPTREDLMKEGLMTKDGSVPEWV